MKTRRRDGWALVGWFFVGVWGAAAINSAAGIHDVPGALRPDEKALLLRVSGGVMIVLALVLAVAAIARLVGDDEGTIAPSSFSLALGWLMIGLFVLLFVWGAPLTKRQGLAALALVVAPYLIGGLAVLVARRRRLDESQAT